MVLWVFTSMFYWTAQPKLLCACMLMLYWAAQPKSFDGFDRVRHGSINKPQKYHKLLRRTGIHCFERSSLWYEKICMRLPCNTVRVIAQIYLRFRMQILFSEKWCQNCFFFFTQPLSVPKRVKNWVYFRHKQSIPAFVYVFFLGKLISENKRFECSSFFFYKQDTQLFSVASKLFWTRCQLFKFYA